jgi:hypothetical protein
MQNCVILLKPLISDVFRYTRLISKLAYRVHEISICPKFSTPEFLLHLGMLLEYFSGRYTFYHPNNRTRAFYRYRLNQKMNMIVVCSNFKKTHFISFFNLQTNILQGLINRFAEYNSSVLRWTNKMVQQNRYIVRLVYIFAFGHSYKDIVSAQQAAGN